MRPYSGLLFSFLLAFLVRGHRRPFSAPVQRSNTFAPPPKKIPLYAEKRPEWSKYMMKEVFINMYIVNKYLSVCNLSVSLVALWHVQLVTKNWTAE